MRIFLFIVVFFALNSIVNGQSAIGQHNLYAKNEIDMYQIFEQLLDTTISYKEMSFFGVELFCSKDTLMKIEQKCHLYRGNANDVICEPNRYKVYLSSSMPTELYVRFYDYLNVLGKSERLFNKLFSIQPLYALRNLLVERYKNETLDTENSAIMYKLIEDITLRIIKEGFNFYFLRGRDIYMTEHIKNALIEVINDPFYPESYLDYYLEEIVDTSMLTINDIPEYVVNQYKRKGFLKDSILRSKYEPRIGIYFEYEKLAQENGITIVDAFLNKCQENFKYKGFINVNDIAFYAVETKDSILISKLKDLKIKHPEYKLPVELP